MRVGEANTAPRMRVSIQIRALKEMQTGLLDWALFRPQARWIRNRRRDFRVFRYLRRSPTQVALAGSETALRRAIIATIAFDRADLIEWQIYLVRRHVGLPFNIFGRTSHSSEMYSHG